MAVKLYGILKDLEGYYLLILNYGVNVHNIGFWEIKQEGETLFKFPKHFKLKSSAPNSVRLRPGKGKSSKQDLFMKKCHHFPTNKRQITISLHDENGKTVDEQILCYDSGCYTLND